MAEEKAKEVLEQILQMLDIQAEVQVEEKEDEVWLNVEADTTSQRPQEMGLLIGKWGRTLEAINYLLNCVGRRDGAGGKRIVVDVQGYQSDKQQKLVQKAMWAADVVRTSRRSMTLEGLSTQDRRIIHTALQDEPDIATRSEGIGRDRHLIVEVKGSL